VTSFRQSKARFALAGRPSSVKGRSGCELGRTKDFSTDFETTWPTITQPMGIAFKPQGSAIVVLTQRGAILTVSGTLICTEPQFQEGRGIHRPLGSSSRLGARCPAGALAARHTVLIKGQGGAACVAEGSGGRFAPANCPHVYHGAVYGPCGANS
jgi:hypothetical protein